MPLSTAPPALDTCAGARAKWDGLFGAVCPWVEFVDKDGVKDMQHTKASCGSSTECKDLISSIDDDALAKMKTGFQACANETGMEVYVRYATGTHLSYATLSTIASACGFPAGTVKALFPSSYKCMADSCNVLAGCDVLAGVQCRDQFGQNVAEMCKLGDGKACHSQCIVDANTTPAELDACATCVIANAGANAGVCYDCFKCYVTELGVDGTKLTWGSVPKPNPSAPARSKDWGKPEYKRCVQPRSWQELLQGDNTDFKTGGLGLLAEENGYETWQCLRDHLCATDAADPWFCFVYHETRKVFTPWGHNSELNLVSPAPCDCNCQCA